MFEWQAVDAKIAGREYKPGEIPQKWYAIDPIDNKRLSEKAMQDGLTEDEANSLWQKKNWSYLKMNMLAKEKMSFAEARSINCWEDLKKFVDRKNAGIDSVILVPAELAPESATIEIPDSAQRSQEAVKEILNTPLEIPIKKDEVVNIPSKKSVGKKSAFANKIGEAVASKL